jgi:hypothetical protein
MLEVIHSSETSVPIRATQHHIAENGILHNECCENLKFYTHVGLSIYQDI